MKTLQKIILRGSPAIGPDSSLLDTANDLPLWPRISSKSGFLTIKEAILVQNPAFVVPWIKDYHQFAQINRVLRQAVNDDVGMLENYVLPALPAFIDEENKKPYIGLINAITLSSSLKQAISKKNKTRRFVVPLIYYRLAARHDGKLCLATDLFDRNDTVFSAAFRVETTSRFLMSEVQKHSALWNELGIRRRQSGRFCGKDYLACLRAIEDRLTGAADQNLSTDIEIVLSPLRTNDAALSDLDVTTWSTVAKAPVFLVSPVSEGELRHRRHRMEILASTRYTLSLKDIVQQEHAAVCWSQTPFALHEPSSCSIQKCGSTGHPTCAMVWQHLAYLAECAQSIEKAEIQGFIEDLQKTYQYLQQKTQESKSQFKQPNAALWLNVETTNPDLISLDVLRSSWTGLEHLLLDTPCDAPPLMTVQSFLGRFSTLLKALGCRSVHYPRVNAAPAGTQETTLTHLQKLWKEGVLTDVTFEAEGNSISAHRVVLATRSLYCRTQFVGPWASSVSESKATSKVISLEDMTYATLKILVEFCYHDHHDWSQDMQVASDDSLSSIADKLDGLLDVLVAADRWLMPDLHADAQSQVFTGSRFFVRPDNVDSVRKVADEANAVDLRNFCEEFCIRNAEAVLLANA